MVAITPFEKYIFVFLSPLIIFWQLGVFYVGCLIWLWAVRKYPLVKKYHEKLPKFILERELKDVFRGRSFDLFKVCYMPFLRPALSIFNCLDIGNGVEVMREEPEILCFVGPLKGAMGLAAIFLFLLVLVYPAFAIFISVWRYRIGKLKYDNSLDPYGVFYQQFSKNFHWFLGVDVIERVLLVSFSIIFAFNEFWYSIAVFTLLVIALSSNLLSNLQFKAR